MKRIRRARQKRHNSRVDRLALPGSDVPTINGTSLLEVSYPELMIIGKGTYSVSD